MHKVLAIAGLAGLSWVVAWTLGPGGGQERPFATEAIRLLDDRSQPWWNKHRPPRNSKPKSYKMTPNDDPGGREDPPILTSIMPIEVAAWIQSGGRPPEGHPLNGRPFVLLDVRRRSEFLAESIRGTTNIPGRDFDRSLESGDLSKMDRATVVVLYGSRWPHFEIVTKLRGPRGFEAIYAMEGLEAWKAKRAPVDRDEKLAQFLKETEAERRAILPPPPPPDNDPIPGMDPRALKRLLDAKVDLLCLFVGDRKTYEDGHVPGTHYVPEADLEKWIADVDKNQLIMVMCGCCVGKGGGPSENALHALEKLGYTRVLHLDGHMNAWKVAGFPVEFDDPPARKKR